MIQVASFYVRGEPRSQGSKRSFPVRDRTGRVVDRRIVEAGGEKWRHWRSQVRDAAITCWGEFRPAIEGPVAVKFRFDRVRPKAHFGSGINGGHLKPGAPTHPLGAPDVLKVARAVEDSLSTVIYQDDAQIVCEIITKEYATTWGVQIDVWEVEHFDTELPHPHQLSLFAIV